MKTSLIPTVNSRIMSAFADNRFWGTSKNVLFQR